MRKDYLLLALLSFAAAFAPLILILYFGLNNFGKSAIILSPVLGLLLSFLMYWHCKNQIKSNINTKKLFGFFVGVLIGVLAITYLFVEVLHLSIYIVIAVVAAAGYFVRNSLKEYTFHEKEFYWGMLGSLVIAAIHAGLLVLSIF